MDRVLTAGSLAVIMVLSVGCATKSYVRKQVTPVLHKVNDLDQRTAENSQAIKDVDARAQEGIQAASASNQQLEQKIAAAGNQSQQATQLASAADNKCTSLVNIASNLDNYHTVKRTLVEFGFNDARLGAEAQQELDQLGGQLTGRKGYIVVVQGGTDNSGNQDYNYNLSQRRAEEVVRYLASKYNVPAYRVHTIAMGPEKPIAPNDTADGRKKNRRAEVQVMTNSGTQPASNVDSSDDEGEEIGQARPARH
jgi:outer membrane protein OmpA-like peptidoglycan-associated protein